MSEAPDQTQTQTQAPAREPSSADALQLARLGEGAHRLSASEFVESLELPARARAIEQRPYVILNMISTVDGRASLDGRSGAIGDRADRVLFHALRIAVDGVIAGAGTVRAERYGRIIPSESARRLRVQRGLREEPLACVVSGRGSLPPELPLLSEPDAHVVLLSQSPASLSGVAAQLDHVTAERDGQLDLPRALGELRKRFGVRTLLGEGGPHLNAELLRAGLVDELLLSLAPKLAGGDGNGGESLRILAGLELEPPIELDLLSTLESDSYLFLRYGVAAPAPAPARVSRETIAKSSLAS
jgi:riboflavin-specific deaminase-like protein